MQLTQVYDILAEQYGDELKELEAGVEVQGNPAAYRVLCTVLQALQAKQLPSVSSEVQQVQQLAWDQLHLGHWKDVPLVWRDVYALMCLLAACLTLHSTPAAPPAPAPAPLTPTTTAAPRLSSMHTTGLHDATQQDAAAPSQSGAGPVQHTGAQHACVDVGVLQAASQGEAATKAQAAVKECDMGIMMGGPLFKSLLHAAIKQLENEGHLSPAPASGTLEQMAHSVQQGTMQSEHGWRDEHPVRDEPAVKRMRHADNGGTAQEAGPLAATNGTQPPSALTAAPAGRGQLMVPLLDDLSAVTAALPAGSLQGGPSGLHSDVPKLHLPSLQQFLISCMAPAQPTVITGAMEAWPALQRWNQLDYLLRVAGHRTVPVEVGSHYLADGWGQRLMTFAEYVQHHIHAAPAALQQLPSQRAHSPLMSQSLACDGAYQPAVSDTSLSTFASADAGGAAAARQAEPPGPTQRQQADGSAAAACAGPVTGYLAQHPLFDQIPALERDVLTPEYCSLGEDEEEGGGLQAINAWFGPAGTVTPLHTDPPNNLLCQVVGYKYVRLYAPQQTPAMYPFTEGITTNSSRVDLHAVDHEACPDFAAAPYQDCVLRPGDMLYIPPGWWHFVQSCTVSFSVSFWWR